MTTDATYSDEVFRRIDEYVVMLRRHQNYVLARAITDALKEGGVDLGEAGVNALAHTIRQHRAQWAHTEWRALHAEG